MSLRSSSFVIASVWARGKSSLAASKTVVRPSNTACATSLARCRSSSDALLSTHLSIHQVYEHCFRSLTGLLVIVDVSECNDLITSVILNAMRKPLLLMLLFSPVMVAAQRMSPPTPDVIATYLATLHEQLSPSCELIQPVTLIQYKQYDALALAGATDEIYSPEFRKG